MARLVEIRELGEAVLGARRSRRVNKNRKKKPEPS
jgi:hypothetical protein